MNAQGLSVDNQCRELIRQWQDGEISEGIARDSIAELLSGSGVAAEVSRELGSWHHALTPGMQLREDLRSEFDDLLFRKVTEQGPEAFFNLERAAESSVTGWARMTLRSARRSLLRNIHNRTTNRVELVTPVSVLTAGNSSTGRAITCAEYSYHSASSEDQEISAGIDLNPVAQRMLIERAADWWSGTGAPARGTKRVFAGAAAIRLAFEIPPTIRPDRQTRVRLQALVEADPLAAHASVRAMLTLVSKGPAGAEAYRSCDQDLLALWDDFSTVDLNALASRDPMLSHALALEAVQDRPRPSRSVLRRLRQQIQALGPMDGRKGRKYAPGWFTCVNGVCNAYLAEEFEAFSVMDTTGAKTHDEKVAGRAIALDLAASHYDRAVAYPGHPLGRTHDEVRRTVERVFNEITEEAGAADAA